jgi:transcriptional regulator GlxA family with amidase domain
LPNNAEITETTVLVLNESNTLSFAAAVDPLRAANRQAGRTLFRWRFATPGSADVMLTSGLRVPGFALQQVSRCDLLIIVAGFDLDTQATPALLASLRRIGKHAGAVAGIDGGPWIMARAGLLEGHKATTHWEDLDAFALHFPGVDVENARFIDSDTRLTSGGAAPAIDMMLHIITQRHGSALADRIAGSFIYEPAASPAHRQSRQSLRARHSALTARAHDIMEANLDEPVQISAVARRLGLSLRALQAQFQNRLKTTPGRHYLGLRLTEADRLVTQSTMSLHEVALATGFASQAAFARAFRRQFGICARDRRAQIAARQ